MHFGEWCRTLGLFEGAMVNEAQRELNLYESHNDDANDLMGRVEVGMLRIVSVKSSKYNASSQTYLVILDAGLNTKRSSNYDDEDRECLIEPVQCDHPQYSKKNHPRGKRMTNDPAMNRVWKGAGETVLTMLFIDQRCSYRMRGISWNPSIARGGEHIHEKLTIIRMLQDRCRLGVAGEVGQVMVGRRWA